MCLHLKGPRMCSFISSIGFWGCGGHILLLLHYLTEWKLGGFKMGGEESIALDRKLMADDRENAFL